METIILNSCSKINLGLNVLNKRADGYHDIETVFYPVKLCDTLSFRKSKTFIFTSSNIALKNNLSNLIIRAKQKLEELTGKTLNAEITLKKYIPLGGGLGGGSSNAAVTLKGLNMLFELGLSVEALYNIALELGSDVPFFIQSMPCFAESRGEKMKTINFTIPKPILIVNPNIHVTTRWAFENIIPKVPSCSLQNIDFLNTPVEKYHELITNDFEEVVFKTFPEIKNIKESLYSSGALFSLMSGSGSTVYGIFNSFEDALNAQNKLSKNYLYFIHYEN